VNLREYIASAVFGFDCCLYISKSASKIRISFLCVVPLCMPDFFVIFFIISELSFLWNGSSGDNDWDWNNDDEDPTAHDIENDPQINRPLYPGSALSVELASFLLVRFMVAFHLSDAACNSLLSLLSGLVLPKDNNMPSSYYRLKQLLKPSLGKVRSFQRYIWYFLVFDGYGLHMSGSLLAIELMLVFFNCW